ncbi:DUF3631 domain-containing protein [Mycobacterium kansasii]|uniref:DUF3631 domain-containing protein n=2 Tax=Mycobacterium kansasii TaxID=1768 RepID=UPI000CDD67DA|nr:DUF3631 domain-containing protein [Mycobacterium kansasii]POX82196.1 hypothetical protein C3B43_25795 [Mycobacterium kansasii]POY20216.1 hypothetical protein C3476_15885 [Mycobacterium kansasii]
MTSDQVARGKEVAQQWAASAGARMLDDLLGTLKRYVVFPDDHAAVAVALWIATTHALAAFECAPRLVITSPEKRCGKTRLLDVITGTCHRPLATANATVAAIFRSIGDDHPPTLVIDEADTIFGSKKVAENNEELRALLNAGHQRGRPALRCVGPMQTPTEFSTFAMVALAGIGTMPDTIVDRGVNITQRRRSAGEKVSQYRSRRDGPKLEQIRERLAKWAIDNIERLRQADPQMPVEDRAADTWEPLIAVADAAGGHWPDTARDACIALVNAADSADEDRSLATKLLTDIQATFTEHHTDFLPSGQLVTALRAIDDSPWSEFELNTSKLAYRLRNFNIKPGRDTTGKIRGYRLDMFTDAFSRYTRQNPSDPSETRPDQAQPSDGSKPSDGSGCQTESARQNENAGQHLYLTDLTGSDTPPAETSQNPSPATMPKRRPQPPPLCPDCRRAPANSKTGLCDFCTAKQRKNPA